MSKKYFTFETFWSGVIYWGWIDDVIFVIERNLIFSVRLI